MRIVHVAARIYAKCGGASILKRGEGLLATGVGTLVLEGPGRGQQRPDETTPEHRLGLERLLPLF